MNEIDPRPDGEEILPQAGSAVDITVLVPCRNEESYIAKTLDQIENQEGAGTRFSYEILIVDGMSDDRTREIISKHAEKNALIRLVDNTGLTTPKAFNTGIRQSWGTYICIVSAHALIAQDYLIRCLDAINRTGADNVGGPRIARGDTFVGKALALAYTSKLAVGGASNHDPDYSGAAKTVPGGFYRRNVYDRAGMYDESLVRNQDDEFNLRLLKSGGSIYQSADIGYVYICRGRIGAIFSQYFQYGFWKVRVISKHRMPASVRHLVPAAFVTVITLLFAASFIHPLGRLGLAVVLGAYAVSLVIAAVVLAATSRQYRIAAITPLIFGLLHFGYGLGFVKAVLTNFDRSAGSPEDGTT